MSKAFYLVAALLILAITLAHVFLGGPVTIDPLMASADMPTEAKWLLYFTWHDGTVALPLCAGALIFAALRPGQQAVASLATLIILGFGLLGLGAALFGSEVLWGAPAPYAFNTIGLIAMAGVLTDRSAA